VLRKTVEVTAAIAAVAWLCFVLMGAVFCAATLHVAHVPTPAPPGAETVTITASDATHLSAWWLKPSQPNGNCVVVLHGISDSRAGSFGFAPLFLSQGYAVLAPDSRGHGASEGRFVTYGLREKYDVLSWAAWMKSSGCRRVYALGESLGASILIQASAVQPAFSAIVAESAFADLREAAEYRVRRMSGLPAVLARPAAWLVVSSGRFYARWADGLDFSQVDPLQAIKCSSTPILLIHGLNDFRTPPSDSVRLAQANPKNVLWLVPNAGHTGAAAAAPEEFRRRVLGWFADH
jgi:hypothetical protein